MISFALSVVTLFRFFGGQVDLELLPFIAECVTNIEIAPVTMVTSVP